jgi:hypothetical protein
MLRSSGSGVLSNWHTLFEDFSTSTQDFYRAVEEAVERRNLPDVETSRVLWSEGGVGSAKREYLRIRRQRVVFDICSAPYGNGHFFSWWLAKVPAKHGLFAVMALLLGFLVGWLFFESAVLQIFGYGCAGAIASALGLFVGIPAGFLLLGSGVERGLIGDEEWVLSIPWVGYLYYVVFNPTAYHRLDTAMMFRDSIRSALKEALNSLREEKGLRPLDDKDFLANPREEKADSET